ncbi:MAG: hypothetical protein ACRENY_09410 [Candidatus Dormibacteria bacterium]
MSWLPGGAAALRRDAVSGLGMGVVEQPAGTHLSPPRIVPFSLMAALVCALCGIGILPLAASVALDVGAAICYLAALRAALPRWPVLPWPRLHFLSGMRPAVLPLTGLVSASVVLAEQPGLPGLVLLPVGVAVLLTVCPWLEVEEERRSASRWAATVLALLTILVPLPILVLALGPSVPAPTRGVAVALAVLLPTWRLVSLTRRGVLESLARAGVVAGLVGFAAGMSAAIQVPIALLPVALLLGWYGLAGVVSQRDGRSGGTFAAFVVLAAVMLAVANPL